MPDRSIGTFSGTVVGMQLGTITNLFVIRPHPTAGRSADVYAWFAAPRGLPALGTCLRCRPGPLPEAPEWVIITRFRYRPKSLAKWFDWRKYSIFHLAD